MKLPEKTIYIGVAVLVLFAALLLLVMLGAFQQLFLVKVLFAKGNPLVVFGIFAIVVFGGIYFLKAGAQIIRIVIK